MKDAESKAGLDHLMDDHELSKFQEQVDEYDKYVLFKVTNINMPAGHSNETTHDSSSFDIDADNKLEYKTESVYHLSDLNLDHGP